MFYYQFLQNIYWNWIYLFIANSVNNFHSVFKLFANIAYILQNGTDFLQFFMNCWYFYQNTILFFLSLTLKCLTLPDQFKECSRILPTLIICKVFGTFRIRRFLTTQNKSALFKAYFFEGLSLFEGGWR